MDSDSARLNRYMPDYEEWSSGHPSPENNGDSEMPHGIEATKWGRESALITLYEGSRHGISVSRLWPESNKPAAMHRLSRLRKLGLVDYKSNVVKLTERGIHMAEMLWEMRHANDDD